MRALETYVRKFNKGFSVTEVYPDQDASYDDAGDCEPEIFVACSGNELESKIEEEFSDDEDAFEALTVGEVVASREAWYYGIAKYEHGGVSYALANSAKSFQWPDQAWDVIPLVGWVKLTKKLRDDWGIADDRELARKNVVGSLEEYEDYCNGSVYCIETTWYQYVSDPKYGDSAVSDITGDTDDDRDCCVVEEDSCCGFVGWKYAEQEAKEMGSSLPSKLVEAGWLSE